MSKILEKSEFEVHKFNIRKSLKAKAQKPQVRARVLTGDISLKPFDHRVQFLDPGGSSRNVTLLPTAHYKADLYFIIYNRADASEDLVIKDHAGSEIVTISQNEGAMIFCDGSSWAVMKGGKT